MYALEICESSSYKKKCLFGDLWGRGVCWHAMRLQWVFRKEMHDHRDHNNPFGRMQQVSTSASKQCFNILFASSLTKDTIPPINSTCLACGLHLWCFCCKKNSLGEARNTTVPDQKQDENYLAFTVIHENIKHCETYPTCRRWCKGLYGE